MNINITVRDVALAISRDLTISMDEQLPVGELTRQLVKKLAWPEKDIYGQSIRYALLIGHEPGAAVLPADLPMASSGILSGSVLVIGPVFGPPAAGPAQSPHQGSAQPTMRPLNGR